MPITGAQINLQKAYLSDNTLRAFTLQAYTIYPLITLTMNLVRPSYIYVSSMSQGVNDAVRANAFAVGAFYDGVQIWPTLIVGQPAGNVRVPITIIVRTPALLAGNHTVDIRVYVYIAGDTTSMRYVNLSLVALPV